MTSFPTTAGSPADSPADSLHQRALERGLARLRAVHPALIATDELRLRPLLQASDFALEVCLRQPALLPGLLADDGAVPATDAFAVQDVVPGAEVVFLRHFGHLMHEEKPEMAAEIVFKAAGIQAN